MNTIKNIATRINSNRKGAAIALTMALVIGGSGLSSLASLSDVLNDRVEFQTISVDLQTGGGAESASITFSGINPADGGTYDQLLVITNSGSAAATVHLDSVVSVGAGTDLDAAIVAVVFGGPTDASPRLGTGTWPTISGLGANVGTFPLNAGASKSLLIRFLISPNEDMVADNLVADLNWTATFP